MKKLLLFVAAVMLLGSAAAQSLPKNIVGVRAGANFSSLDFELLGAFDFRTNFNAGVSYERLLLKNLPLYLETGLHYSNKGFKYSDFYDYEDDYEYEDSYGTRISLSYIEVPVMLNYKFFIGNDIALYPSAGVYYAFGVAGNAVETFNGEKLGEPSDVFGEDGLLRRSDFGYRVGISASWRNFVLSAGYEGSILNVAQPFIEDFGIISLKAKNLNIFVTLGYNLNF
ncbi:MAG: outer membrane beta-barrel protein [Tidjanibacter sp.]|nr:outer membrane beta-barrel protein [Tidjanibacter sp.]